MHVRFSMSLGLPVVTDMGEEMAGMITGVFVHPDLGQVAGFFVGAMFLSSMDIVHWGTRLRIRSFDVLAPLSENIRLQSLVSEGRTVLGQKILTESGVFLGTCRDIQFETKTFRLEWIFPRKWFLWKTPIPVSAIVEVKKEAIIVRNVFLEVPASPVRKALDELAEVGKSSMPETT